MNYQFLETINFRKIITAADHIIRVLPFFIIIGGFSMINPVNCCMNYAWLYQSTVYLIEGPKYSTTAFLAVGCTRN